MRLILEKEEIVKILGEHFETELDPANVVIRTAPVLEIEVSGIPLVSTSAASPSAGERPSVEVRHTSENDTAFGVKEVSRAEPHAFLTPPPPGRDLPEDDENMSPADLVAKSRELRAAMERDVTLARRSGGSLTNPKYTPDEIK